MRPTKESVEPTSNITNGQIMTKEPAPVSALDKLDAGLRSLDHYKNKLPLWRYSPRQRLIPLVRWETPYLATMQKRMRSPALDSYFSITANLGTHTFFMVFLPILFWCGYTSFGRGMVHILASGVFFSGFLKDLLCLPRPLSPPLQRITMSESVALEYGFPSTHTTNAVSVAVYAILALHSPESTTPPRVKLLLEILSYSYATSIMLGRLYCGMHGFFDIVVGAVLGASISGVQYTYGDAFDNFIYSSSFKGPLIVILVVLILVRLHPEPADNCPCFDDSVAFGAVFIGVELGHWHYARSGFAWDNPVPSTVPFQLEALGLPMTILRIILGVLVIFAWREVMKPTMLRFLPPIFRVVESLGLSLPRRFFMQASKYKKVPNIEEDNVIPSMSDFPAMLTQIRHPRRSRSVSIGPQSAADAYETLAFREKRRRESISSMVDRNSVIRERSRPEELESYLGFITSNSTPQKYVTPAMLPTPAPSELNLSQYMTGEPKLFRPITPDSELAIPRTIDRRLSDDRRQYEREDREMFSKLEKPRVRYDVEVIAKLIVYTGIAWIAVEGNPLLFELVGLGLGKQTGQGLVL